MNPGYFLKDPEAFDLRADSKPDFVKNTRTVKSAFWNKKTHFVLQKKVEMKQTNINTNTRSFAKNYSRGAPKHKIRQQYKQKSDQPQPGYYDTKAAFDKMVAPKLINSVRMQKNTARRDAFAGRQDTYGASKDTRKMPNMWIGEDGPQTHVNYAQMISREAGTKAIEVANLKWMFVKSNE